jgi:hypothetical protein
MRYARFVAAILLAAYIPACTGYTTLADPAASLSASPKPIGQVRITLKNGKRFELAAPLVAGDSLRGTPAGGPPMSFALADVAKVEAQKTDAARTAGLVVGVVLLGGVIAGAIALASQPTTCSWDGEVDTGVL